MAAPVCKVQVSGEELLRGLVDVDELPKFRISGVATAPASMALAA